MTMEGDIRSSSMAVRHGPRLLLPRTTTASPKPTVRAFWKVAMPWRAEEVLDGQCQRVDVPTHARTAYDGLPQNRLKQDIC